MNNGVGSVQLLSALLREAGAVPNIAPDRIVRSTLYDLDYHLALVACAFDINGEPALDDSRALHAQWLKLLQFLAARPALVEPFGRWARARRSKTIDTWQDMPRGFLGDRTHDKTIELLVAARVLERRGEDLHESERAEFIREIHAKVVGDGLLLSEREALEELGGYRVNKTLLFGR